MNLQKIISLNLPNNITDIVVSNTGKTLLCKRGDNIISIMMTLDMEKEITIVSHEKADINDPVYCNDEYGIINNMDHFFELLYLYKLNSFEKVGESSDIVNSPIFGPIIMNDKLIINMCTYKIENKKLQKEKSLTEDVLVFLGELIPDFPIYLFEHIFSPSKIRCITKEFFTIRDEYDSFIGNINGDILKLNNMYISNIFNERFVLMYNRTKKEHKIFLCKIE